MTRGDRRTLFLVRHGETAGQSSIRYYGSTDVVLSEEGRRQMLELRQAFRVAGVSFDLAITSALRRTQDAASILAPSIPVRSLPELNEIDFGDWEGLTEDEIRSRDPGRHAQWRLFPDTFVYPCGESVQRFRLRVWKAFQALLPFLPDRTLFVIHKGVIRTILGNLLVSSDDGLGLNVALGSVQVVVESHGGWEPRLLDATPRDLVARFSRCARR